MSPHVTFWRPLEGSHSSGCRVYNALQWSFLLCAASQNRQAIPNLPNNPSSFGNLWDQPAPIGMQCTVCAARAKARKGVPRVSTAFQMPQRCRTLPGDFARLLMVWCHKLTTLFLLHPAVWLMLSELSVSSPWVVVLSNKFNALITLGRL